MEYGYILSIHGIIMGQKDLSLCDKCLYATISGLSTKYGFCYASNKYFSTAIGVSISSISRSLKVLSDKNYIQTNIQYASDKRTVVSRNIKINNSKIEQLIEQKQYYEKLEVLNSALHVNEPTIKYGKR